MPPVPQQNSRAGLITTVVILAILTVGLLSSTIYYNSQQRLAFQELDKLKDKSKPFYNDTNVANNSLIERLKKERKNNQLSYLDVSGDETEQAVKAITGVPGDWAAAVKDAQDAMNNANLDFAKPPFGLNVPKESLVGALDALSKGLQQKQAEVDARVKDIEGLKAQMAQADEAHKGELAKRDEAVNAASEASKAAMVKVTAVEAERDQLTKQIQEASQLDSQGQGAKINELTAQVNATDAAKRKVEKENKALKDDKTRWRFDVKAPIVQVVDAHVIRVPNKNLCYIDLGSNDHLPKGLTFEIYDKSYGVPALGDGLNTETSSLPVGKGSIQVINVGTTSSECQIVNMKNGETLSEGDLCVNAVYDKNMTYNYFVFGDFDPTNQNQWSPQGAEVIKNLVRRFGGQVVDHVGVNTDFIVMGREPSTPDYGKDHSNTPFEEAMIAKSKEAKAKYEEILKQAADLHIPVMNQSRFMYYTGYFDSARR